MNIEEMRDKKKKLEIEILDSLNAFMKETKVTIDDIDIGVVMVHPEWGGVQEFREINISVNL